MKLVSYFFKLFGGDKNVLSNRVVNHLVKNEQLNKHLVSYREGNELQKQYVQYLPDRYAANFGLYKQQLDFFNYDDVKKCTAGFYENNVGDLARFFFLNLCIDQLLEEKLNGDIAELGVFKGNSAFLLAKLARRINSQCYLFDTFEGFDERDFAVNEEKRYVQDFSGTSLAEVKALVGEENTVYVKGFFPDSLQQVQEPGELILVHIDCDLEMPFRAALIYFYPKLKPGGFLIMHDYTSLYWPGAKKAMNEFFADKPEFLIPIPDKSGTCVIRKI